MASSTRMSTAISRIATRWAGMLTTIAKEFAPEHTKQYIHSKTSEIGDGQYSITVGVNLEENPLPKYGSKDAMAQEMGSGERGELGEPITILPKNGRFLVFKWDVADQNPKNFRMTPDGKVMLTKVESPGIYKYKGLGYLKPAIDELKAKARQDMNPDIVEAITGDIRAAFRHAR